MLRKGKKVNLLEGREFQLTLNIHGLLNVTTVDSPAPKIPVYSTKCDKSLKNMIHK